MSIPITIPAQGIVDSAGNCLISFSAPPLGTSYIASVSVVDSPANVNWQVSVGLAVGQSFGGGAFGPLNIPESTPVTLSAIGFSLTVGTIYHATLSGTADSTENTDWTSPNPQVPSVDINGANVNVTGGTIDIGNNPAVTVSNALTISSGTIDVGTGNINIANVPLATGVQTTNYSSGAYGFVSAGTSGTIYSNPGLAVTLMSAWVCATSGTGQIWIVLDSSGAYLCMCTGPGTGNNNNMSISFPNGLHVPAGLAINLDTNGTCSGYGGITYAF